MRSAVKGGAGGEMCQVENVRYFGGDFPFAVVCLRSLQIPAAPGEGVAAAVPGEGTNLFGVGCVCVCLFARTRTLVIARRSVAHIEMLQQWDRWEEREAGQRRRRYLSACLCVLVTGLTCQHRIGY